MFRFNLSSEKSDEKESSMDCWDSKVNRLEGQKFLREFIEAYHSHECLWKYSSIHYRNREVKDDAWDALVDKMREYDKRAEKPSVVKKINALRAAFRREHRKVQQAEDLARNASHLPAYMRTRYSPNLWYYHLLKFVVEEQEADEFNQATRSNCSVDTCREEAILVNPPTPNPTAEPTYSIVDQHGNVDKHTTETFIKDLEDKAPPEQTDPERRSQLTTEPQTEGLLHEVKLEPPATPPESPIPWHSTETMFVARPKRQAVQQQESLDKSDSANRHLGELNTPWQSAKRLRAEDPEHEPNQPLDLDRFSAYVVSKLKRSSPKQCIIAEKLIAEVLMHANLGSLGETTTLTDVITTLNRTT